MDKLIKFNVLINCDAVTTDGTTVIGKIRLIKALRDATDMGLKEAKDCIENSDNRYGKWLMTSKQFGTWMAHKALLSAQCSHFDSPIEVTNIEFQDVDIAYDFTK